MSLALVFDLLLAIALLWSAWRALAAPEATRAVVMFIVFGLLLTLAWARLDAPDIALAEAAIGAGLTGALLLDALGAGRGERGGGERGRGEKDRAAARWRRPVLALSPLLAAVLVVALLKAPAPAVDLPAAVARNMAQSGVAHPVTAVLLNFRGYDTLLEVAVLLAALFGLLALAPGRPRAGAPGDPLLGTWARLAAAPMIVVAGYLLWAGAHQPGGAFQAAAVLAAAAVLLHLAGLLPACCGWGWPAACWCFSRWPCCRWATPRCSPIRPPGRGR
ncbi:MAG: hydrogenase subunit MbhD domain-containing protein [Pseudomonadota bacterium]